MQVCQLLVARGAACMRLCGSLHLPALRGRCSHSSVPPQLEADASAMANAKVTLGSCANVVKKIVSARWRWVHPRATYAARRGSAALHGRGAGQAGPGRAGPGPPQPVWIPAPTHPPTQVPEASVKEVPAVGTISSSADVGRALIQARLIQACTHAAPAGGAPAG